MGGEEETNFKERFSYPLSTFAKKEQNSFQLSENVTKPLVCPSGDREQNPQNMRLDCAHRINPQKHRIFSKETEELTMLSAIVLRECLCLCGRAGTSTCQSRCPEGTAFKKVMFRRLTRAQGPSPATPQSWPCSKSLTRPSSFMEEDRGARN